MHFTCFLCLLHIIICILWGWGESNLGYPIYFASMISLSTNTSFTLFDLSCFSTAFSKRVGSHHRKQPHIFEREMGFEPTTLWLVTRCSTTELLSHFYPESFNWVIVSLTIFATCNDFYLSRRRDSNPQPPAWKASALPIELLLH